MNRKKSVNQDLPTSLNRNLFTVLIIALFSLVGVIAVYALWFGGFKSLPAGGPETWGQFGDYVGGILSPILGFLTIIILILTLLIQRRELESARSHARTERFLRYMDVLSDELNHLLENKIRVWLEEKAGYGTRMTGYFSTDLKAVPARNIFNVDAIHDRSRMVVGKGTLESMMRSDGMNEWDAQWHGNLGKLLKMLIELNEVIEAIKSEPDTETLTRFYVARWKHVSQAALIHKYLKWHQIPALVPEDHFEQRIREGYKVWHRTENGECEVANVISEATGTA